MKCERFRSNADDSHEVKTATATCPHAAQPIWCEVVHNSVLPEEGERTDEETRTSNDRRIDGHSSLSLSFVVWVEASRSVDASRSLPETRTPHR
jgi:hypothetical protein